MWRTSRLPILLFSSSAIFAVHRLGDPTHTPDIAAQSQVASSVVNTGAFAASSGTLALEPGGPVAFTNTGGTITALNGGAVQLFGSTDTGGTLTTAASGVMQFSGGVILNWVSNSGDLQGEHRRAARHDKQLRSDQRSLCDDSANGCAKDDVAWQTGLRKLP